MIRHQFPTALAGFALGVTFLTLTACGNQAVAPSASPTPSATPSPSRPSVAPSPAPSADPAQAAIKAFVVFASDPKAAYQATFTGKSRHTVDILPISDGLLQVNAANVRVRATFTFPSKAAPAVEHRFVDGAAWVKFGADPWQRLKPFTVANAMAAFPAVKGTADVTYLGPTTVKGKNFYEVRVASAIVHPLMIPASNLTEEAVTTRQLTVLIDPAGKPVSGTAEIRGSGRVSGQLQEIVIDLDVVFTKLGQPVSIQAP